MHVFLDLSESLRLVDISNNPWRCDCRLKNLKSFIELEKKQMAAEEASSLSASALSLKDIKSWRHRILRSQSLLCSSPSNLAGVNVVSTLRLSQLTCSPPSILREPASDKVVAIFGETFNLRLRISGVGTPSVQWFDALMSPLPPLDEAAATAVLGKDASKNKIPDGTRYAFHRIIGPVENDADRSTVDGDSSVHPYAYRLSLPAFAAFQSFRTLSDGEIESTMSIPKASYLSNGKYLIVVRTAGGVLNRTYYVKVRTKRGMKPGVGHDPHSKWHESRSLMLMVLLCLIFCFACIFQKQIDRFKYTPKRNSNQ